MCRIKSIQTRTELTGKEYNVISSSDGYETPGICLQRRRFRFDPWVGKIPWRREWQPTPRFLPGESHGQRSLEGYRPWSCRVRQD